MKKMEVRQMEAVHGGTNRQCLIDGIITAGLIGLGAFGGFVGVAVAALTGLGAANSNGCFNKQTH
jgi:hypothetical protein